MMLRLLSSLLVAVAVAPAQMPPGFATALANAASVPVHVVVQGDSMAGCWLPVCAAGPNARASLWTEQLRAKLTASYGSHGTGIVPIQIGVTGPPTINSADWTLSGNYSLDSSAGPSLAGYGGSLYVLNPATATFSPHLGDTAYVYVPGWSGPFIASFDGVDAGTFQASPFGYVKIPIPGGLGYHSAAIRNVPGQPAVVLYGIGYTVGSGGVDLSNVSEGACPALCFGDPSYPNQVMFTDALGAQLYIISLGTNEDFAGVRAATYQQNLQTVVNRAMALPSHPEVIILNEPWVSSTMGADQTPYYAAAAQVAANTGAYLYDPSRFYQSFANEQAQGWEQSNGNSHFDDAGQLATWQWFSGQMFGTPVGTNSQQTLANTFRFDAAGNLNTYLGGNLVMVQSATQDVAALNRFIAVVGFLDNANHLTTPPPCNPGQRNLKMSVDGGTGVADTYQVCAKDANDQYAWHSIPIQ